MSVIDLSNAPVTDVTRKRIVGMVDDALVVAQLLERYEGVPKAAVFGSARLTSNHPSWQQAYAFSALFAAHGGLVVNGGGPGIMEAAQIGARLGWLLLYPEALIQKPSLHGSINVGAKIAGEAPPKWKLADPNYVMMEILSQRQEEMVHNVNIAAFFVGGGGTGYEFFDVFCKTQLQMWGPGPICLVEPENTDSFWRPTVHVLARMVREGTIDAEDFAMVRIVDSGEAAFDEYERFTDHVIEVRKSEDGMTNFIINGQISHQRFELVAESIKRAYGVDEDIRLVYVDGEQALQVASSFARKGHHWHTITEYLSSSDEVLAQHACATTTLRQRVLEQISGMDMQTIARSDGVPHLNGVPSQVMAKAVLAAQGLNQLRSAVERARELLETEAAFAKILIDNAPQIAELLATHPENAGIAEVLAPAVNSESEVVKFLRQKRPAADLLETIASFNPELPDERSLASADALNPEAFESIDRRLLFDLVSHVNQVRGAQRRLATSLRLDAASVVAEIRYLIPSKAKDATEALAAVNSQLPANLRVATRGYGRE